MRLVTAQIFGLLYYASPVWLGQTLEATSWRMINSVHFKALRLVCNDHHSRISRIKLSKELQRATPLEWSRYCLASTVIKVCREQAPEGLNNQVHENMYFERRNPERAKFFDNSKIKIGRQKLSCRLNCMNNLSPWYGKQLDDNSVRLLLKKHYFSYCN